MSPDQLSALNAQVCAIGFGGGLTFGMAMWAVWNFLDWLMDKLLQRQQVRSEVKP